MIKSRRRAQGIVLAVFLFFLQMVCYAEQPLTQSKEMSDPYTWDFGSIKQGEVVAHDFTLKNESEKTLTIIGVNTSCGCTVSEARDKVLGPQELTLIGVKFNSKDYSGAVRQFVYVNTDSLDKPLIRFIIKANVV